MTVLSPLFGISMDRGINEPGNKKNVVDGINATENSNLKEKMELVGNLKLTTHQILEFFHAPKKMVPSILYYNVYILSPIRID